MRDQKKSKDKRGLARIVESVFAILLVASVLLIIAGNQNAREDPDLSTFITPFLEEIAQNQTLREKILDPDKELEARAEILAFLEGTLPDPRIERNVEICNATSLCPMNAFPSNAEEVFARERIITSDFTQDARKVKIFLWRSSS